MKTWSVIAAFVGVFVIAPSSDLDSCFIDPPVAVFTTTQRPSDLTSFSKGKLGVLRRSYGQTYLIGAFRTLSGSPLTDAEAASLYSPSSQNANVANPYANSGLEAWLAARKAVRGLPPAPAIQPYKTVMTSGSSYSFLNCQNDAFFKASEILASLASAWGPEDPRTLEWVRGQDIVFSNCVGKDVSIPVKLSKDDPVPAAYRTYQIAAAHFYSGQFRKAVEVFRKISADPESPWREWAPYLIARALLRSGMIDRDQAAFQEGKAQLESIVRTAELSEWHESSLGLLHLWQLRVEPKTRLAELSRDLMRPSKSEITQTVIDFLYLVNRRRDGTGVELSAAEIGEIEKTSELAAWLFSMSSQRPADAPERAIEWWRKKQSPAWLIAALANANEPDLPELLQAARRISPDAPAYESVAYYAISREEARGHRSEARRLADMALSQKLSRSGRNLIRAKRMQVALDWDDFLRYSLRRPEPHMAVFEDHENEGDTPMPSGSAPVFDWDVIDALTAQVPLSLWVNAVRNPLLPGYMQLRVAEAGWYRAVLLGKFEEARSLLQRAGELQPWAQKLTGSFVERQDSREAQHAATYLMLRVPALSPVLPAPEFATPNLATARSVATDAYGHRIGCWYRLEEGGRKPHPVDTGFLSAEQRAAAAAEWKQIREAKACGATYVLRQTLEWAETDSSDPRLPEALHRAVMASYYRSTDEETGKLSKQAYELLHKRYPNSDWAIRTKYWYK